MHDLVTALKPCVPARHAIVTPPMTTEKFEGADQTFIMREYPQGRDQPGIDRNSGVSKTRYKVMRRACDALQFYVITAQPAADWLGARVSVSKRLGPSVPDLHRRPLQVVKR